MVSARESSSQLAALADDSVDTVQWMLRRTSGAWESRRLQLLDTVPGMIGYYSEGSAALAVDYYNDERSKIRQPQRYAAEPVILDRTVRIRRGIAWASTPLEVDDEAAAAARFAELMRSEMVRPYRDTMLTNRKSDPACIGWQRITSPSACGFCRMAAAKGAVYKESTASFAAHDNCKCTCSPVFRGGAVGPEASVEQYIAAKRRRTPAEKARLRDYIATYFPD